MPNPRRIQTTEEAPVRWRYDEKMPNAPRRNPLERPTPGIFDSPYVCLKINILWLPHIMGALDVLTAWDAWQGDNDGLSARDEIEKLFAAMRDGGACLEFGESLMLRQNPTNFCLLEQSLDGGETWIPAFDFSKCKPRNTPADDLLMYDRYQIVIQNYRDDWDADPGVENFTPDLVYDSTSRDADRDLALCFALGTLFDAIKEARIEVTGEAKPATQAIAGVIIAVGIVVAGVATGGIAWAAYAAVAGVAASAFIEAGFALSAGVTSDTYDSVRDDIICCMYNALKGSTLEQADFQTSLSGCDFEADSPQDLVADEIIQVIQSDDMYLAMLKYMDESLGILDRGYELPECPCACRAYNFLFVSGAPDVYAEVLSGNTQSQWASGQGWITIHRDIYRNQINLPLDEGCPAILLEWSQSGVMNFHGYGWRDDTTNQFSSIGTFTQPNVAGDHSEMISIDYETKPEWATSIMVFLSSTADLSSAWKSAEYA